MDCPPGSSVQRILQARVLEWVAVISDLEGKKKNPGPHFLLFPVHASLGQERGGPPKWGGGPGSPLSGAVRLGSGVLMHLVAGLGGGCGASSGVLTGCCGRGPGW